MSSPAPRRYRGRNGSTPTVLLVHDAFADTATWAAAIASGRHSGAGHLAVANPLRGLATDAGYVAALAASIDGPIVLIGHGYGGAVVSVAAATASNVVGVGFVAALVPDAGECCVDLLRRWHGEEFFGALRPRRLEVGGAAITELSLDPDLFPAVAAADLPREVALVAAACQRPVAAAALEEPAGAAGWREVPSWYLVATADRLVDARAQRAMAVRAGATTFEVEASHAVATARPEAVAELIAAIAASDKST